MKKLFVLFLLVALVPFTVGCSFWGSDDDKVNWQDGKSSTVKLKIPVGKLGSLRGAEPAPGTKVKVNGIDFTVDPSSDKNFTVLIAVFTTADTVKDAKAKLETGILEVVNGTKVVIIAVKLKVSTDLIVEIGDHAPQAQEIAAANISTPVERLANATAADVTVRFGDKTLVASPTTEVTSLKFYVTGVTSTWTTVIGVAKTGGSSKVLDANDVKFTDATNTATATIELANGVATQSKGEYTITVSATSADKAKYHSGVYKITYK